jgi:hypothetical protein
MMETERPEVTPWREAHRAHGGCIEVTVIGDDERNDERVYICLGCREKSHLRPAALLTPDATTTNGYRWNMTTFALLILPAALLASMLALLRCVGWL